VQAFRGLASLRLPALLDEILKPLLALPPSDAVLVGGTLIGRLSARPRRLPRLADLLVDLLAPAPAEPARQPDPDPDVAADDPMPVVPQAVVTTAARVVACVGLPARLSELLAGTEPLAPLPAPSSRPGAATQAGAPGGDDGPRRTASSRDEPEGGAGPACLCQGRVV
jgi:hypothetical protein